MRASPIPTSSMLRFVTRKATSGGSRPRTPIGRRQTPLSWSDAAVEDADIDEETGELRCKLSDGSLLDVKPAAREADDDPPNWELSTPGGVVLEFGPGVRWQISSADAPVSSRH